MPLAIAASVNKLCKDFMGIPAGNKLNNCIEHVLKFSNAYFGKLFAALCTNWMSGQEYLYTYTKLHLFLPDRYLVRRAYIISVFFYNLFYKAED